jgi:hypothetical protein
MMQTRRVMVLTSAFNDWATRWGVDANQNCDVVKGPGDKLHPRPDEANRFLTYSWIGHKAAIFTIISAQNLQNPSACTMCLDLSGWRARKRYVPNI